MCWFNHFTPIYYTLYKAKNSRYRTLYVRWFFILGIVYKNTPLWSSL